MKKIFRAAAAAGAMLVSSGALGAPENVAIGKNGIVNIAGQEFYINHFDKQWQSSGQKNKNFQIIKSNGDAADFSLEGKLPTRDGKFLKVTEEVKVVPDGRISYQAEVTSPEAVATSALTVNTIFQAEQFCGRKIIIDGKKEILLPAEYNDKKGFKLFGGKANELMIPTADGRIVIRGKLSITLQDDRKWNNQCYSLRLGFSPENGNLTRSSINLDFNYTPYQSQPISLRPVMNMGLRDEVSNDRLGGWTDQGGQNDLRMLAPGMKRLNGVSFDIVNPASNNGKACLMLAGPDRNYFPAEAEIAVNGVKHQWLYLLHALAWAPSQAVVIGKITVTYQDGSKTVIPVTSNIDVGNWWAPSPRPNGAVVWTGENQSAYVGLYRSAFKVKAEPIKSVRFESARNSVWGIVALSASNELVPAAVNTPTYIIAGKEWQPMPYRKDIKKNSILDFSTRLDAPAGKYGKVIIRNGKLVFANRPDVPVRFYGENLCGTAQYLDKEWAERLTERLAASGYNAVRIHHQDNPLSLKKDGKSTGLDPVKLDQLEYFIFCLKKRGLYISTDMYVSRSLVKGEIPEFPDKVISRKSFKALAFVCDSVMNNWEEFTRNWMTHVNPYTGLALKDDPVLISISLINEDNIASTCRQEPWITDYYYQKFAAWLTAKGEKADHANMQHRLWPQFLVETYDRAFLRMKKFVRSLGIDNIISDQNMQEQPILSLMRTLYDYVDNHFYWDHPGFPVVEWRLPSSLNNMSAIARYAHSPARCFPSRLFGKPMMITEFDFARPNFFRAEGAVLTGAYAALQDWDALFHFAYSHSDSNVKNDEAVAGHFDTSTDALKALSQRIGIIQFLWNQVAPSTVAFAVPVTGLSGKDFNQNYPEEINRLGLIAQVGSVVPVNGKIAPAAMPKYLRGLINIETPIAPDFGGLPLFDASKPGVSIFPPMLKHGVLKPEWIDIEHGICRSTTGQIELNQQAKTLKVVSPGCEVLILPEKTAGTGKFLQIDNRESQAVFCAAAIDNQTLPASRRILLLHLTDTQASKLKFGNKKMTLMENWGTTPLLAKKGVATVTLAGAANGGKYSLFAVDTAGERLYQVPVAADANGHPQFKVNVLAGKEPVMAYELIRE